MNMTMNKNDTKEVCVINAFVTVAYQQLCKQKTTVNNSKTTKFYKQKINIRLSLQLLFGIEDWNIC